MLKHQVKIQDMLKCLISIEEETLMKNNAENEKHNHIIYEIDDFNDNNEVKKLKIVQKYLDDKY